MKYSDPTITAVVVDYFTRSATRGVIDDLREQRGIEQIIVVDNSGDPEYAAGWELNEGFDVLISPTRQGYGAGVNFGARFATGDMLLILNSDLRVVSGEFLDLATGMGSADGVVGPLILDPQHFPQRDSWGIIPPIDALTKGSPRWITGACMLLQRDVFVTVGGFDERYFMYWEDVDLCRELWGRELGARVDHRLVLRHMSGHSQSSRRESYRYAARSRDLYLDKWSAPLTTRLKARARGIARTAYQRGWSM